MYIVTLCSVGMINSNWNITICIYTEDWLHRNVFYFGRTGGRDQ